MWEKDELFLDSVQKRRIKLQTDWEMMYTSEYIYRMRQVMDERIKGKVKSVPLDPLVPIPATISEISPKEPLTL